MIITALQLCPKAPAEIKAVLIGTEHTEKTNLALGILHLI